MRLPSTVIDQVIYFVAVDIIDLATRKTGLTTFTVYRSRNGSAAVAMTTPTITEVSAANMPGVYKLLLDEDMTIGAGNETEEFAFHITQASMAPVTRTIELYRSLSATSIDNLKTMYDGTGYIADTAPATQSQLGSIANVGAAINKPAATYVLTSGVQSLGTVADTEALDGVNHQHTDTAGAMDLYYEFLIGGGTPTSVTATGYLNGNNDDLEVQGFDWVTSTYKQIGTVPGTNSTTNGVVSFELFVDMVGKGVDLGKVRVRFTDGAFTLTGATLAIDQIFISFAPAEGGYEQGSIWIDTNASNTGTIAGIDGVATNPVSTMTAANTLSASVNLNRFEIAPGSSITFATPQSNRVFFGNAWTLDLGGQDVSNCYIEGADISGSGTGAGQQIFMDCRVMAFTPPPGTNFVNCAIEGNQVLPLGDVFYDNCYHGASVIPQFDFGAAVGNTTVHVHHWAGPLDFRNMGQSGTDIVHLDGMGKIIVNANCIGGTLNARGNFEITNNGSATINQDARYDVSQIKAQADQALIDGPLAASAVTGTLTATDMTTSLTETTDAHYNGRTVIFTSGTLTGQATVITSYTGATKLVTMLALTEPPLNGDTFIIV